MNPQTETLPTTNGHLKQLLAREVRILRKRLLAQERRFSARMNAPDSPPADQAKVAVRQSGHTSKLPKTKPKTKIDADLASLYRQIDDADAQLAPTRYRAKVGRFVRTGYLPNGSTTDSFPSLKDRKGRQMNPSRLPSRDSSSRFVSPPGQALGEENEFPHVLSPPSAQNGGSDETAAFQPWTAADILRNGTQPREPRWLCDCLIPLGRLVLLSAYAKVGKTELAYQLVMDVARGEPFLGYATRKGGRAALILAVEEHPEDIRHRLLKLGLKLTDKVHVYPKRLDPPIGMLSTVSRYITQHKIRLVILDTLSGWWKPESENSNVEIHSWIRHLLDLARLTGAAVLVLHHSRKGGGEYGEEVRGGGDLLAQVDQAFMLKRGKNLPTHQRVLENEGRYRRWTPPALLLDYTGDPPRYRSLGTPKDRSVETLKARVISTLRSEGTLSTGALMKKTGLKWKLFKKIMNRLLAEKNVSRSGAGHKGDPHRWALVASRRRFKRRLVVRVRQ